jgi:hypothetical protein
VGHHHVSIADLHHAEGQGAADVGVEIGLWGAIDLGDRAEGSHRADADREAAGVTRLHPPLDGDAGLLGLIEHVAGGVPGEAAGEANAPLVYAQHIALNEGADLGELVDHLGGIDDPLRLGAEIDEDAVGADSDDAPLDAVALLGAVGRPGAEQGGEVVLAELVELGHQGVGVHAGAGRRAHGGACGGDRR